MTASVRVHVWPGRLVKEDEAMTAVGLGRYVRERRLALGLSQEQLAELVGGNTIQSDISRIERGHVDMPRPATLVSLATALDVPVGNLLIAAGWFDEMSGTIESGASADQAALLDTVKELEAEVRSLREVEQETHARTGEVKKLLAALKNSLALSPLSPPPDAPNRPPATDPAPSGE